MANHEGVCAGCFAGRAPPRKRTPRAPQRHNHARHARRGARTIPTAKYARQTMAVMRCRQRTGQRSVAAQARAGEVKGTVGLKRNYRRVVRPANRQVSNAQEKVVRALSSAPAVAAAGSRSYVRSTAYRAQYARADPAMARWYARVEPNRHER